MSFDAFKNQLKENKFGNLYIFCGEEEYLRDYYLNLLKKKIVKDYEQFNFSKFEGSGTDVSAVASAVETFPVMAERKLIFIKDSGAFSSKGADKEQWANIFKDVPEYTTVIFCENDIDKRGKVYKAFLQANGMVVDFEYRKESDLKAWTANILNKNGIFCDNKTILYFLGCCNPGMNSIKNELDKLISYCTGKKRIDKADVDLVVSKSLEDRIYALTDCIMECQSSRAFEILSDLKELKESPVRIISSIFYSLSDIYRAKVWLTEGESVQSAATKLKKPFRFMAEKCVKQAQKSDIEALKRAIGFCREADMDIKQGRMNDWLALELLVYKLFDNLRLAC